MFDKVYESEGAVMKDWFGVQYPESFTDSLAEYHALTTTAALIDLCHWGVLRLEGKDSIRLLDSLTTNDAASLAIGEGCRSAITTRKGKLIAELYVLRRETELTVLVPQGDTREVFETIEKHIIADDVDVEDRSDSAAAFSVEGPKSRQVLWRLMPERPIPERRLSFVDADHLRLPFTVVRNSVTGEEGYQVLVDTGVSSMIRNYLIQSGRADDMLLAGRIAWNARRVEEGLPWWGADVTPGENFPKECRMDDVVSYEKGCFLGQETLARMHHRGHPNWLLVGLTPRGATPNPVSDLDISEAILPGSPLFHSADLEKEIGRVTSSVHSPKLQKPLALGYVRAELADPGTELVLRTADGEAPCVVLALPLSKSTAT